MIGLLQRVTSASVSVAGEDIARIGPGLLVLVGVEKHDSPATAARLAERLCNYRVFADDDGRMNLSLTDTGGEALLVPQFTLPADTRKGNRPGFSRGADPETGQALFADLVSEFERRNMPVQTGKFGADMQVSLVNDGPVTFWLQVPPDSEST